ncbi:RusA family crossover junction endodeoxyribonuclease [Nostoc punctiforme UO1]|uniref:RusA family crossover junction endodeoxyribonuclease n=1 Tax=Nostoc punctiforme TaxID=272131 RepID=UPI0030A7F7F7
MSDDELIKALEAANDGKVPSPFGSLEFKIPGSPVSIQAKKAARDEYVTRIKSSFGKIDYFLIGDIHLEFRWYISAKSRYETDANSDLDNALKPTIDALTGLDGLFIDDCQVRSLHVAWSHSMSGTEYINVRIDFASDEWCCRDDIIFIDIGQGLCVLAPKLLPTEGKQLWTSMLKTRAISKDALLSFGVSYPSVASLLGAPRPFHRTRVRGFEVATLNEYVNNS